MTAFDRIMLDSGKRADIDRLATDPAYRAEYRAAMDAAYNARKAEIEAERHEQLLMIAQLATIAADDPETEYEFALAVSRFAGADTFAEWIETVTPEDTNAAEIAASDAIEARILRNAQ